MSTIETPPVGTKIRVIGEAPGYQFPRTGEREGVVVDDDTGVVNMFGTDDEFLAMIGTEAKTLVSIPYEGTFYRASHEGITWERIEEEA